MPPKKYPKPPNHPSQLSASDISPLSVHDYAHGVPSVHSIPPDNQADNRDNSQQVSLQANQSEVQNPTPTGHDTND
ncbi:MAG: hypothetical protein MJE68_07865, partial [Proteobacteria bacterium]|nr:hypothetical protein [Pseudomonadota bacterium]